MSDAIDAERPTTHDDRRARWSCHLTGAAATRRC
jgi:hypothetical protein